MLSGTQLDYLREACIRLFDCFDQDCSGSVDFDEFVTGISGILKRGFAVLLR